MENEINHLKKALHILDIADSRWTISPIMFTLCKPRARESSWKVTRNPYDRYSSHSPPIVGHSETWPNRYTYLSQTKYRIWKLLPEDPTQSHRAHLEWNDAGVELAREPNWYTRRGEVHGGRSWPRDASRERRMWCILHETRDLRRELCLW